MSSTLSDYKFRTFLFIWLDDSIDFQENINIKKNFQFLENNLQIFKNLDECKNHIRSISSQDQIKLIVNDYFGQQFIPEIHCLPQIFSIYIYCRNEQCNYQWTEKYTKVKGVYQQLDDLFNKIGYNRSRRQENRRDEQISISIFNSNNSFEQSTTGIDGRFVQYQLLIDCILKMETISTDKSDFISKCRECYNAQKAEQDTIDYFEKNYESEHALWWYTLDTFLYRVLNKALRTQDIDSLYLLGFFIRDLEQELRRRRHPSRIHTYRSQLMSIEEVNLLEHSTEQLISINSFFSTTLNRNKAIFLLGEPDNNNQLQRVLFEIEADPCQDGIKPFADISGISKFDEEEVLMMLGSVFRLKSVSRDEKKLWHIKMNLCSDNDCDLQNIFYHMRQQYGSNTTRLILFGNALIDMAKFNEAERYLRRLLPQILSKDKDVCKCYHALGKISCEKGDYKRSLDYLRKSLNHLPKLESNDSRIAYIYTSMGEVYQKQGKIQQALESFQKALDIFKQTFSDDDENLAWCYNNLGMIYLDHKNYDQALYYLNKSLNIKTKVLPDGHPCLANTYINLGNVHYYRHEYDHALEKYEVSYKIFKRSLTPQHPSVARALKNIGVVYETKKNFIEAKKNYEEAFNIRKLFVAESHPDVIEIGNDIERVSLKIQ
ncbi:unnamed protein product [Rotaria sp. Silwood2]|nr:unnamed protein product [Rotaria sp. Silwood2]CAF3868504.1 unnamed protein product [Rotaria sp. Silwood2]CAF3894208.1 unnamed protein product [Rotaria sp. Silwood2]